MAADRVRVTWGKVDNFKCVDFFQIEYYEDHDPVNTVQMSGKINKNRKSLDINIKPCSDYRFKVIASEDWKGMREDFKTASEIMEFKLEFTPKVTVTVKINQLIYFQTPISAEKTSCGEGEENPAEGAQGGPGFRRSAQEKEVTFVRGDRPHPLPTQTASCQDPIQYLVNRYSDILDTRYRDTRYIESGCPGG